MIVKIVRHLLTLLSPSLQEKLFFAVRQTMMESSNSVTLFPRNTISQQSRRSTRLEHKIRLKLKRRSTKRLSCQAKELHSVCMVQCLHLTASQSQTEMLQPAAMIMLRLLQSRNQRANSESWVSSQAKLIQSPSIQIRSSEHYQERN